MCSFLLSSDKREEKKEANLASALTAKCRQKFLALRRKKKTMLV